MSAVRRTCIVAAVIAVCIAGSSVANPGAGHSAGHAASSTGAAEAFGRIVEGNERFVAGTSRAADISANRRKELATGQQPFAVVLACADSRVSPEHMFNAGLGELFVIRVAGNVANPDAIASTEYALAHLGTKLVIVLGHESCGAVKAAAADAKDTPAIVGLVSQIAPAVAVAREEGHAEAALINRAINVNTQKAREKLINQSELIKQLVHKGEVKVVAGRYDLASGKVQWLNTDGLTPSVAATTAVPDTDSPKH